MISTEEVIRKLRLTVKPISIPQRQKLKGLLGLALEDYVPHMWESRSEMFYCHMSPQLVDYKKASFVQHELLKHNIHYALLFTEKPSWWNKQKSKWHKLLFTYFEFKD